MYHIVSFPSTTDNTEEVEIVHEHWILEDRQTCFFPPFMRGQFSKALKTGMKPGAGWKTYSMRIIHSYDSYEKACEWLPMAEVTSHLETDCEDVQTKKKRRRNKKKKLVDSSGDEGDHSLGSAFPSHNFNLPLPPTVNLNLPLPPTVPNLHSHSLLKESAPDIIELSGLVEQHDVMEDNSQLVNRNASTSQVSTPSWLQLTPQVQVTPFQKKVLRWMAETEKKIDENRMMLSSILLLLQGSHPESNVVDSEFPKLPVKSLKEFKDLEDFIGNTSNFNKLVNYLSKKGGSDVGDTTKRMLKALLDYRLATEFNWAGRGKKQAFKESKIKMLIICAVRESSVCKSANEKEIEEAIKSFLKYAPLRVKYVHNKSLM